MNIAGWLALLQPLQGPSCRLEKLDEVAAVLTNAFASNSRLRELDLR
jgi:hypothetical protein